MRLLLRDNRNFGARAEAAELVGIDFSDGRDLFRPQSTKLKYHIPLRRGAVTKYGFPTPLQFQEQRSQLLAMAEDIPLELLVQCRGRKRRLLTEDFLYGVGGGHRRF